ncbi:MAG: putative nucleotidyltransferase substrate binding domain-containing protein [Propionibacteriaceae bacterium]
MTVASSRNQNDADQNDADQDADLAVLRTFLGAHPPFDALSDDERAPMSAAATIRRFEPGAEILDAFTQPSVAVFVVMSGQVDLWHDADRIGEPADERLGVGGVFGFSAMLTERSVGPRVVAVDHVVAAAIPAAAVEPAFASRRGARFLAEQGTVTRRVGHPSYSLVDELIVSKPLVVAPDDHVADVARLMTERGVSCAAVPLGEGRFGLVTDTLLRQRVLVGGLPGSAPAREVMDDSVPISVLGDSAAEALILMLDRQSEFLLVTNRAGELRGVITPRDFAVSPTTAGVSVHEQVRRAATVEELRQRTKRVPPMMSDLLFRGLASGKVIAVYSAIIDTVVRRTLNLVFDQHPELSLDAFTWLSLGSNGRREAVLSSDVDSAVAFDDSVSDTEIDRYRAAFAEVDRLLADFGMISDEHGATAERAPFARRNADWRAAAQEWMLAPEKNQGAIMTSLLVDGRPIHGDLGLPAVSKVFSDLRRHPGTMRLLLEESLSKRAKLRSVRDVFARRDVFDVKTQALLPIVNMARWAALSVGSAALPTTERLLAASGSEMLPDEQARNLVEAFDMLQRLRLRYQLIQQQRGEQASDVLTKDRMSPIDRSMVAQAVREIAAVQRRMDNIAVYVPSASWASPAGT